MRNVLCHHEANNHPYALFQVKPLYYGENDEAGGNGDIGGLARALAQLIISCSPADDL